MSSSFRLTETFLTPDAPIPIRDLYTFTKHTSSSSWGIQEYKVPKKTTYIPPMSIKLPKAKKESIFEPEKIRATEPDPARYALSNEEITRRDWISQTGGFSKSPRRTLLDALADSAKGSPGPGSYEPTDYTEPKISLGKMSKESGINFLSTVQAQAEENPSVGEYLSNFETREKAYNLKEKKSPVFKYSPIKAAKPSEKIKVGPGYLSNLETTIENKSVGKRKCPSYRFAKASNLSTDRGRNYVPGVGHYKEKERAYSNFIVTKKTRQAFISQCRSGRSNEEEAQKKMWVPGPGAYEILPPLMK